MATMENVHPNREDDQEGLEKKKERAKNREPDALGHMLMTASEKAPISHTGKSAVEAASRLSKLERSVERSLRPSSEKRVETLSRAELLRLSEDIVVDGSSLRQIYETHLIGERGLRRLIAEQARGGDLKKALHREIIARELDFERDPALRDVTVPQSLNDSQAAGSKSDRKALNELLEQAAASLDDTSEEAAFYKARALYEASQLQQHKQQRRWIDISLAFAIAILLILVIILLGRR